MPKEIESLAYLETVIGREIDEAHDHPNILGKAPDVHASGAMY